MGDLKENIIKTLESKGILDSIKAQLKSQVLQALESQSGKGQVFKPESLKIMESEEGKICVELIREFLEFAKFKSTLEVFIPEGHLSSANADRILLETKTGVRFEQGKPLLMTILEKLKGQNSPFGINSPAKVAKEEPPRQIIPKFQALLEENSKKVYTFSGKSKEEPKPDIYAFPDKPIENFKVVEPVKKEPEIKPPEPKKVIETKPIEQPKTDPNDKFKLAPLGKVGKKPATFKGFDDLVEDEPPKQQRQVSPPKKQVSPPPKKTDVFDSEESIEESIEEYSEDYESIHKDLLESIGTSSMGVDVSVNSLALEEFDHVERVKPAR
ncbi:unnamed protein product [Blepharisma stoltei]|uniref:FGFR1 oncogene partner (FOP) N-terminal dimerisation domain-containing protein n=1 Tax=Blepharisma stoltei TaxID=1481888 RepID=A0AAU9JY99_9CILI|nr:unnamed protein product [Blepharisma stoltei]